MPLAVEIPLAVGKRIFTKGGCAMRKLIFTLSALNAILNALVIAIFMPHEVFILYDISGHAVATGSRWFYLIWAAVPVVFSGIMLLIKKFDKNAKNTEHTEDDEITNPIDEMFAEDSLSSDNWDMVVTWACAIFSWVLTGIALNEIENIGVIMPSIIVMMLSAGVIFLSSFYREVAPNSVAGIPLSWLPKSEEIRSKTNRVSFYSGVMGGFAGICLAAWSLVISNNFPNCLAIIVLLIFAVIIPIIYSYSLYKIAENKK